MKFRLLAAPLFSVIAIVASSIAIAAPPVTTYPVSVATVAPASGITAYHGCTLGTANDFFNKDISSAAVDGSSNGYITSMSAVASGAIAMSYGIAPENDATSATATYPVLTKNTNFNSGNSYNSNMPWQSSFGIEAVSGGNAGGYVNTGTPNAPSGDGHSIVLATDTCTLWEAYNTNWNASRSLSQSGTLSSPLVAYSMQTRNLNAAYATEYGVTAGGLSILMGAIRPSDFLPGAPYHALDFDFGPSHATSGGAARAPACCNDGYSYTGSDTTDPQMPYGAHLRLKASYTCPAGGNYPEANWLCNDLKHAGMFIMDNASTNKWFSVNPTSGEPAYNQSDLGQFSPHITDFEVLTNGQ